MKKSWDTFKLFLLKTLLPAGVLTFAVLFALNPVSCKASPETIEFLEGDFTVPEMTGYCVKNEKLVEISFTKKVTLESASLFEKDGKEFCAVSATGDSSLSFNFANPTEIGREYVLEAVVKDATGNSLSFSFSFIGFNSNPAKVVLSEVRNAYGTATVTSGDVKNTVHKSEFVELYVQKSGSLSGLEIYSVYDGDSKKFVLPPVDVEEGEYIVCHMRTIAADGFDGQGMVSELNADFTLSTHLDSCDSARDLWSSNTKACFGDTDIIVVKNSGDHTVYDALVYAKSGVTEYSDAFNEMYLKLKEEGLWSGEPFNADLITSSGTGRSISRQGNLFAGSEDWLVTSDTGSGSKKIIGVTPGYENSSNVK